MRFLRVLSADDMFSDMAFDDFTHQSLKSTASRSQGLKYLVTVLTPFKCIADGAKLALESLDSSDQLFFALDCVCHSVGGYIIKERPSSSNRGLGLLDKAKKASMLKTFASVGVENGYKGKK